jgi:hypothetical protein
MLIYKVLIHYIISGVLCAMTGTRFTGDMIIFVEIIILQLYDVIMTSFEL